MRLLDRLAPFLFPYCTSTAEKLKGRTMAFSVEISCINRQSRTDPHQRISYVGGLNADRTTWKLSLDEAIAGIESDKWTFWTMGGGKRADVIIAYHNGNKYLKTVADAVHPDNLLALPDCP
jgi:hypothetical protein